MGIGEGSRAVAPFAVKGVRVACAFLRARCVRARAFEHVRAGTCIRACACGRVHSSACVRAPTGPTGLVEHGVDAVAVEPARLRARVAALDGAAAAGPRRDVRARERYNADLIITRVRDEEPAAGRVERKARRRAEAGGRADCVDGAGGGASGQEVRKAGRERDGADVVGRGAAVAVRGVELAARGVDRERPGIVQPNCVGLVRVDRVLKAARVRDDRAAGREAGLHLRDGPRRAVAAVDGVLHAVPADDGRRARKVVHAAHEGGDDAERRHLADAVRDDLADEEVVVRVDRQAGRLVEARHRARAVVEAGQARAAAHKGRDGAVGFDLADTIVSVVRHEPERVEGGGAVASGEAAA